jgi:hypothetical protein
VTIFELTVPPGRLKEMPEAEAEGQSAKSSVIV